MNTVVNNEQVLDEAEKDFKASMFDVIAFYQDIMRKLEVIIFNGDNSVNSQTERDTWAAYHELLSNVILDTNSLMHSLTPLHDKAKECMNIIHQRTSNSVNKEKEDEALHEVTSVVSKTSEDNNDNHIKDLENQIEELKALLEETTSNLTETLTEKINTSIEEAKSAASDYDAMRELIRGELEKVEFNKEPPKESEATISDDQSVGESTVESNPVEEGDIAEPEKDTETNAASMEEKENTESEMGYKKVIIIPDDRFAGSSNEGSNPVEEGDIAEPEKDTETNAASMEEKENTESEMGYKKVVIIPDDRFAGASNVDNNSSPVDMSSVEEPKEFVSDISNDIEIQENPEVNKPVVGDVSENMEPVIEEVQDVVEVPMPVDSNVMPPFTEISAVADSVAMPSASESDATVSEVPVAEVSQPVVRPTKVFAVSAGYKGNALSVTPTQGANLRKSKEEQKAKIISIIPYLGKGESTSKGISQPALVNPAPMEIETVSEEQLAEMVDQVSALYNEQRYAEAEALTQKISELSKQYSAQVGKVLTKEYPTQMAA